MAMDHNQGRRGHFHRGRRGPDRRGPERRQGPAPEQSARGERLERVDVEQLMREIRSRIAQRSGIELSNQQIQELAARRLEAILDPRGLKPELLDQLRRSAGERTINVDDAAAAAAEAFPFDEASLYESPNAFLRFIRKLFHPFLRMLFNPTPIAHALAQQSRFNAELAAREAERDRRQAEWNALHYEMLKRLALEVSRASIECQALGLRVESLSTKVDYNERRVRGLEGSQAHARPPRPSEVVPSPPSAQASGAATSDAGSPAPAGSETPSGDAPRRRRRRRRGRRGPGAGAPAESGAGVAPGSADIAVVDIEEAEAESDDGFEEEISAERVEHHEEAIVPVATTPAPESTPSPAAEPMPAPERAPETSPRSPEE